ncbi:TP53-target gene 5 protein [Saccopteryx leptura]|uniref:TP53-target gene 5 protein n=1 Tax=Saccopteryx leptura TaxID=249018 RepID=UPI00339C66AF
MVLRNLSLLKLLKSSNPRINELHNLAKSCWNSLLRVQKFLLISPRNRSVCEKVGQNNKELQEARSGKKLESRKLESIGEPNELKPKVGLRERKKVQQSGAAAPESGQVEPEAPKTSSGPGLATSPEAWRRQLPTGDPGAVFLNTHHGDMEQLEAADQWTWCKGLPTRIHLPGPRVMCRSSTLRWVKRCCTRFCSASIERPVCHPERV